MLQNTLSRALNNMAYMETEEAIEMFQPHIWAVQVIATADAHPDSDPVNKIVFRAIDTIFQILLQSEDELKNEIREAGGVQAMVGLLRKFRSREKALTLVMDSLRMLSMHHHQTKQIILQADGPKLAVEILQTADNVILLSCTAGLLMVLSAYQPSKMAVLQAGGFDALSKCLPPH